jgi:hypothetical protein
MRCSCLPTLIRRDENGTFRSIIIAESKRMVTPNPSNGVIQPSDFFSKNNAKKFYCGDHAADLDAIKKIFF